MNDEKIIIRYNKRKSSHRNHGNIKISELNEELKEASIIDSVNKKKSKIKVVETDDHIHYEDNNDIASHFSRISRLSHLSRLSNNASLKKKYRKIKKSKPKIDKRHKSVMIAKYYPKNRLIYF